jgi:hypothetical protein
MQMPTKETLTRLLRNPGIKHVLVVVPEGGWFGGKVIPLLREISAEESLPIVGLYPEEVVFTNGTRVRCETIFKFHQKARNLGQAAVVLDDDVLTLMEYYLQYELPLN